MRDTTKAFASLLLAALLAGGPWSAAAVRAQEVPAGSGAESVSSKGPISARSEVDWETGLVRIEVELDFASAGLRLPAGRLEAERSIERSLPGLVKDAVFGLRLDSRRTVGQALEAGDIGVDELLGLSARAERRDATLSRDLRLLRTRYELPLVAISALFVRHREAAPLVPPLGWSPSAPYTGLVIVVPAELPVRGEKASASLEPSLFPKVWDADMRLLLDRNLVDPEIQREAGAVAWAARESSALESRVGAYPLRVAAEALFGVARTDLVISRADAARILALPENRALVAAGKVAVVSAEALGKR